MNPHDSSVDPDDLSAEDEAFLATAAQSLRTHEDSRWVEVSSRILSTALRATRRSRTVLAQAPGGPVHISEHVIITYLRDALDGPVAGTAVAAIHLDITGRDVFSGVLIELIVQYGTPILPVADLIHARATAVLLDLLGPAATAIHVRTSHVHVSDVTVHDPQIAEPSRRPRPPG